MSIFRKELKKYVIESKMGDGKVSIKVKFVYRYFMFNKCVFSHYDIDLIDFSNVVDAQEYAKHAEGQSSVSCIRVYDNYAYHECCHNNAYNIDTDYKDAVNKAAYSLHQFNDIRKFVILYIKFRMHPPKYMIAEKHCKYDEYSGNLEYTYVDLSKGLSFEGRTLDDCYDKFSKALNGIIKKHIEEKRRDTLSNTLVEYNEISVEKNTDTNLIPIEICPMDNSRNQVIQDELKRVSEYTNFLKQLIR